MQHRAVFRTFPQVGFLLSMSPHFHPKLLHATSRGSRICWRETESNPPSFPVMADAKIPTSTGPISLQLGKVHAIEGDTAAVVVKEVRQLRIIEQDLPAD
jgi:hypothetical protein